MMESTSLTVDALAVQERDEFCEAGWMKLLAPAKVNLFLAIGDRRDDGYHQAATVMQALMLHDLVYVRPKLPTHESFGSGLPEVRMVGDADVVPPVIAADDNLVFKAICAGAGAFGPKGAADVEVRIQKRIPFQAGLGGASSDAAAALVALAIRAGIGPQDARVAEVAAALGADVAFFLYGGCAYLEGAGERFVRDLRPSHRPVVLVKPKGGVPTAQAYRAFDRAPVPVAAQEALRAAQGESADDVPLFNNLAPASETILPELGAVRQWLADQPGVGGCLLCGSGAATFGVCDDFASACAAVAGARKRGWWARATSFGGLRAACVNAGGFQ